MSNIPNIPHALPSASVSLDPEPAPVCCGCGRGPEVFDEVLEALEELVRRTPFVPHENGIQLVIGFEQLKRQQAAIAKAKGAAV